MRIEWLLATTSAGHVYVYREMNAQYETKTKIQSRWAESEFHPCHSYYLSKHTSTRHVSIKMLVTIQREQSVFCVSGHVRRASLKPRKPVSTHAPYLSTLWLRQKWLEWRKGLLQIAQ